MTASGLLTRPGVPELHRAALAASLGADLATLAPPDKTRTAARTRRRTPGGHGGGRRAGRARPPPWPGCGPGTRT